MDSSTRSSRSGMSGRQSKKCDPFQSSADTLDLERRVVDDTRTRMKDNMTHDNEGKTVSLHSGSTIDNDDCGEIEKNAIMSERKLGAMKSISRRNRVKDEIITAMYISMFAMLGTLARIVLAELFGDKCENAENIDGLFKTENALCVSSENGGPGIIYSDIPSNMLGCFLLGLFSSGLFLELPSDIPIPILSQVSGVQSLSQILIALRIGFCGSLTSYSSWNTEMIVMVFSTVPERASGKFVKALMGYIIGIEISLSSLTAGKNMASYIARKTNPAVAKESDFIHLQPADSSILINKELPGFERRYLAGIYEKRERKSGNPQTISFLEKWKQSTDQVRNSNSEKCEYLSILREVEKIVIVNGQVPLKTHREFISTHGLRWDISSLETWKMQKDSEIRHQNNNGENTSSGNELSNWDWLESYFIVVPLFSLSMYLLSSGIWIFFDDNKEQVFLRTVLYSMLLSPLGALLRWKLSYLNGDYLNEESTSWLPLGTLLGNLFGSMVSIAMVATEASSPIFLHQSFFKGIGTVQAVKIGFAGSLSTVSTFVSEISVLQKQFPRNCRSYLYISVTISLTCLFGIIIYGWISYTE